MKNVGIQAPLSSDWWESAAWYPVEVKDADGVVAEAGAEESEEMREVIGVETDGLEYIQPDLDVASRL